jgi:hypothetical protein
MSVKNIMFEIEGLIKNTVVSCASLYGFSVEEALAKIDSNGNLIRAVKATVDKEALVEQKLRLKAEKLRLKEEKEAEKEALAKQKEAEKLRLKEEKEALSKQKEAENLRLKEAEKLRVKEEKEAEKIQKEAEKSERSSMKEEEILSKTAEKLALKASLKQQKKAVKKVVIAEICDVVPTQSKSEDDDCFILFQNIPLMNEINSICDVKKFKNYKKLSKGVKLARQILDI